jgi:hypothetical protein
MRTRLIALPTLILCAGAPLAVDVGFGRGRTLYALAQGTWGYPTPIQHEENS